MTTAIVGVGNIGSALARHLVAGGEPVVLAAKDESRAQALAGELGPLAGAASVEDAISGADTVVLAVWLDSMRELIPAYAHVLKDKVVIDPSNPIGFDASKPMGLDGSMTTLSLSTCAYAGISSLMLSSQTASTTVSAPLIASSTEAAPASGPSSPARACARDSSFAARTTGSPPATRCLARALPMLPTPTIAVVIVPAFAELASSHVSVMPSGRSPKDW